MGAAVAALGGIAEREQKALVAAREILQTQVASGREGERRAGEIADRHVGIARQAGLDQPIVVQYVNWVGTLARGDLGKSYKSRNPISEAFTTLPWAMRIALSTT